MEEIYNAKKVEQINGYLFIDTYKSNRPNIKISVNDRPMTVNDSEMCEMKRRSLVKKIKRIK